VVHQQLGAKDRKLVYSMEAELVARLKEEEKVLVQGHAVGIRFVRQQIGLDNLQIMIPFCRTPEEGRQVVQLLDTA
jgi:phosphoenolpyruvate synthase/pyruvate phosphate dikinase